MKVEYIDSGTFVGGEEDACNMFDGDKEQDCYVLTLSQIREIYKLGRSSNSFSRNKPEILRIVE